MGNKGEGINSMPALAYSCRKVRSVSPDSTFPSDGRISLNSKCLQNEALQSDLGLNAGIFLKRDSASTILPNFSSKEEQKMSIFPWFELGADVCEIVSLPLRQNSKFLKNDKITLK
jgi:hypothetical protein